MLFVGLSGGIGSGKSTVSRRLVELGAVIVDADAIAREVVQPGSAGLAAVVATFGEAVLSTDGSLNRAALGAKVFADSSERQKLEAITHPLIRDRTLELVASAPPHAIVIHDVPLLVEKQMGADYPLVIIVDAPASLRLQRLVDDRGMTEADAQARIAAQATDAERFAAADVVLNNTSTPESLRAAIDSLWSERLQPYAENVRLRRRAPAPPVRLGDQEFGEAAARVLARLRRAGGQHLTDATHIGSTSVPGLPAKPVIDIQLGVTDLRIADEPQFIDALLGKGFAQVPGATGDHPHTWDPDPARWAKRFFASCDPAQAVQVHIRERGSAGWLAALQFAEWLRADPNHRAAYLAEKKLLATQFTNSDEYASAKEAWFAASLPEVRRWVSRTDWTPPPSEQAAR